MNTILTGEALFTALKDVDPLQIQDGLQRAEKHIDYTLNLIASRLGLDHDRVLGSRYSFPLVCRYLDVRDGVLKNYQERDRLLYWYVHTFLWGRYAGSTESKLNQDLGLSRKGRCARPVNHRLTSRAGDLRLQAEDFWGWSLGARFYPMLYMLTRVWHTRDWETGIELSNHLLGHLSKLQLHHIFPKSVLYEHGYDKTQVNALANFTFLTKETNLKVSNQEPANYLEIYAVKHPGVVKSH